jgi:hypothetical protein
MAINHLLIAVVIMSISTRVTDVLILCTAGNGHTYLFIFFVESRLLFEIIEWEFFELTDEIVFNDMCNEELLKLFESRRQVSCVFGCGLQILVHCIVKFVLRCFRAIKLGLIGFIECLCCKLPG